MDTSKFKTKAEREVAGDMTTKDNTLMETIEALGRTHEEFKETNLKSHAEIKEHGEALADTKEKLDRMNSELTELSKIKQSIDDIQAKMNRPSGGFDSGELDAESAQYKEAFFGKGGWVRSGRKEDELRDIQAKSTNIGTPADGGFAVPEEIDRKVLELQRNASTMRQRANVISVGTSDHKSLVDLEGVGAGWVGEATARPALASPTLGQIVTVFGEVYASPKATQYSLDDMFFDVEAWLTGSIQKKFTTMENTAFFTGTGTLMPKGFLDSTMSTNPDATRTFGELQNFVTGVAATLPATGQAMYQKAVDMIQSMKPGYRQNANWLASSLTTSTIRQQLDADNRPYWLPSLVAGQPATYIGYAYDEDEAMPDEAANAFPLAFGDFKSGYQIVDRIGTSVSIRDNVTDKPHVIFYASKRVGGNVTDSNAIKVLKCSV